MFDFDERLAFSLTRGDCGVEALIRERFAKIVQLDKLRSTSADSGVDYIAHLDQGAMIRIDLKTRGTGAAAHWQCGADGRLIEDLALETWSSIPMGTSGHVGWTRDASKQTDYTLHVFDPAESLAAYLLPFQLLRSAFLKHSGVWCSNYKVGKQPNQRNGRFWHSECVFVPAPVVLDAVRAEMEFARPDSASR